jgi:hypothetical protein
LGHNCSNSNATYGHILHFFRSKKYLVDQVKEFGGPRMVCGPVFRTTASDTKHKKLLANRYIFPVHQMIIKLFLNIF